MAISSPREPQGPTTVLKNRKAARTQSEFLGLSMGEPSLSPRQHRPGVRVGVQVLTTSPEYFLDVPSLYPYPSDKSGTRVVVVAPSGLAPVFLLYCNIFVT